MGLQGVRGPMGEAGLPGPRGADGADIFILREKPTPALGNDGDIAVVKPFFELFKKARGVWEGQGYLRGPVGPQGPPGEGGSGSISDDAYDAATWNGDATHAPSKNAVRDQVETMLTQIAGKEPAVTADTITSYYRGDKTFQTLNTTAVTEGANLYFTDARAQAAVDTETLTWSNKSLLDTTTFIRNTSETTKRLQFDLSQQLTNTAINILSPTAGGDVQLKTGTMVTDTGQVELSFKTFEMDTSSFRSAFSGGQLGVDLTGVSNSALAYLIFSHSASRNYFFPNASGGVLLDSAAATVINKTFGDALRVAEVAAPSTPASGFGFFYFGTDSVPYAKNDAGAVSYLGGRAATVALWDGGLAGIVKTNIGTSFVDVYTTTAGLNGRRQKVDFTGYTQFQVMTHWNHTGTGNLELLVLDAVSTSSNLLSTITMTGAGQKEGEASFATLPAWATGQKYLKIQARSTVSTDDPIFFDCTVQLK